MLYIISFLLSVALVILFKKYMKLKDDHYLLLSDYETLTNRNNKLRNYKDDLVNACYALLNYVRSKYEIPKDEDFSCPHIQNIHHIIVENEDKSL